MTERAGQQALLDAREQLGPEGLWSHSLRPLAALTLLLSLAAYAQWLAPIVRVGVILTSWKWALAAVLGLLILGAELALVSGAGRSFWQVVLARAYTAIQQPSRHAGFNGVLFALSLLVVPALIMGPTGPYMRPLGPRLLALWVMTLISAVLLCRAWRGGNPTICLAASLLAHAALYQTVTFLPGLSTYPLSLGWSEASRYYYGSLFFSERVYGVAAPPSVLHPTRYLLQALPFLIPASPLWFHRLWQAALWVGFTLLSAWLLARRLALPGRWQRVLVTLWTFLFLFQGPILYHLLVPVIVVLWGFERERFWKSLVVLALASAWAGISRVNWIPVPAMLAATLYCLEKPLGGERLWRYLAPPAIWGLVGSLVALAAQAAYIAWSGNEPTQFGSSFSSQLLWYRLLPSATYPLGVLPAALLISGPLLALIAMRLQPRWRSYTPIRLLALAAMSGVLFTAGVVVSTKIGGGSNLHNLDSFLILLAVIGTYIYFDRFQPDTTSETLQAIPVWLTGLILAVPAAFALTAGGPLTRPDAARARAVVEEIRAAAEKAAQAGEEVLFISERHLLTFHMVQGVPLVPDYEKVFLMEMAMSNNQPYLQALRADLQNHRFGLIVSHPQRILYQGRNHPFGEENDAWVARVSEALLCYYEPLVTYKDVGVQLLVPRRGAADCP